MKSLVIAACFVGVGCLLFAGCGSSADKVSLTPDGGSHSSGGSPSTSVGGSGGIVDIHMIPDSGPIGVIMCDQLGTWCHPFDHTTLGHTCHETGHTGDVAACAAIYDECVALCHPADAGGDAAVVQLGPNCEALASACDPFENNDGGTGHDCHELGHMGDEAACTAQYSTCMAVCAPADASTASDAGDASDAG
ncbi:MAG TPA: hypothetical protein VL137_09710 [Polyangiaceae bacterium]|nr:hypothetical protein [Polyangiaceae bacterium]